eukprot:jgi/Chrzof1/3433/Cz12g25080.t1
MSKEDQINEAKKRVREAFIVFEHREGSKLVDAREIPTIVCSLGVNPTTAQLQALQERITQASPDETNMVALEHCEGIIATFLIENKDALARDDYHTLMRAFRACDEESKGFVDYEQFKTLLTSGADALSMEEANLMVSFAADDMGRIYYEDYAYQLATDGRTV